MSFTQSPTQTNGRDVINVARKTRNLTDQALASASGIARSTLRTKIQNVDLFTVAELKRLGQALGVDYMTWLEPVAA